MDSSARKVQAERNRRRLPLGPSSKLTVAKTGKVTVTLSYGVYEAGDSLGAPSGRKRVRFRLEGTRIRALDTIPLDSARFQRRR
jgi:hypothetical protein